MLSVATIVSLVGLVAPAHASGDDYPYRGLGQCPLVPLPPKHPGLQTGGAPGKPGAPVHPGGTSHPGQPGQSGTPHGGPHPTTPPGPPKPPPPRVCAKHIWFYNGSYGDPWGFALRNCTSFVAWRLRMTNGMDDFENHFGGVHWGNAENWDDAAAELGYLVDDVPAVGAVAQTDSGRVGHVAWVMAVGDGTVTVEEYNMAVAGGYDVRTVPTSDFRYLHLADTAPAPYLGSSRPGVATADAHDGTWSARTTAGGDLLVNRPSGHPVRLGAHGMWSADAAPSVVTDAHGRIWVAAVTQGGRVLALHTASGSVALLASAAHPRRGHDVVAGAGCRRPGSRSPSRGLRCRDASRAAHAGRSVGPMEPPPTDGQARVVVDPRRTLRRHGPAWWRLGRRRHPPGLGPHVAHDPCRPGVVGDASGGPPGLVQHVDACVGRGGRRPGLARHRR